MIVGNALLKRRGLTVALAVLAVGLWATTAQAYVIANFQPEPASPALPEFIWDGTFLYEGPGALGTGYGNPGPGDGDLPPENQDIPGLTITSPFSIPGVPGSVVGGGNTTFFDTTLDILPPGSAPPGLPAVGPAIPASTTINQPLGPGAFEIWSTDPVPGDPDAMVLLLAGTVDDALITGLAGATTGATLSATVTYTGGAIFDAAVVELGPGFADPLTGSFSWTLLDMSAPLAINPQLPFTINPFTANGNGLFSGIPEPGTLALLGIGSLFLAIRRRRIVE